jgi:hypothetical protein
MGIIARNKLDEYYEQFRQIMLPFNKDVVRVTGLQPKLVTCKCGAAFFPCVVAAVSFESVQVIVPTQSGVIEELKKSGNTLAVRFCFKPWRANGEVAFIVNGRVAKIEPQAASILFTVNYSQRPPDDLIEIVGELLKANACAASHNNEQFNATTAVLEKMRFLCNDVILKVNTVVKRCIIRSIGFDGTRLLVQHATPAELQGQRGSLTFEFDDPRELCTIAATFDKTDAVDGHNDITIVNAVYADATPMTYRLRLTNYVSTIPPQRKDKSDNSKTTKDNKKAKK